MVKTGGTPKVPDCFQRTPKKLCIPEKAEILAVNVDSKGEAFKKKFEICFFVSVDNQFILSVDLQFCAEFFPNIEYICPSSRSPRSAENW